eukprot:gene3397-biopygen8245
MIPRNHSGRSSYPAGEEALPEEARRAGRCAALVDAAAGAVHPQHVPHPRAVVVVRVRVARALAAQRRMVDEEAGVRDAAQRRVRRRGGERGRDLVAV